MSRNVYGVFFDLDETLISGNESKVGDLNDRQRAVAPVKSCLTRGSQYSRERFVIRKRAIADDLIAVGHEIFGKDNVHVLTVGTRNYAKAVIDAWDLPFDDRSIIAREDFVHPHENGGHVLDLETVGPKTEISACVMQGHLNNVLIDNQTCDEWYAQCKMRFLGIDPDSMFTIREFTGKENCRNSESQQVESLRQFLLKVKRRTQDIDHELAVRANIDRLTRRAVEFANAELKKVMRYSK